MYIYISHFAILHTELGASHDIVDILYDDCFSCVLDCPPALWDLEQFTVAICFPECHLLGLVPNPYLFFSQWNFARLKPAHDYESNVQFLSPTPLKNTRGMN